MAKEELDVLGQMLVARRVKQRLFGATAPLRGNRYVPLERVGRGGGGTVYRAYDSKLRREVAIKLLHLSTGPSQEEVDQASQVVLREARSLASLAHPHVVAVYDVGRVANGELVSDQDQAEPKDTSVFLVMELVEGQDLGSYIAEHRPSFAQILGLFEQAASGLSAAHEVGLVHRDFKPSNVLVGKDGRVRVIDFGLARIASLDPEEQRETSSRSNSPENNEGSGLVGTPAYMSPEARLRQTVGPRSDQFSFCVAFYEALYGLRPEACRPNESLPRLAPALHGLPPGTPDDFASRLAIGLQADPEQRYENMAQLMLALRSSRSRWLRHWWPALVATLVGLMAWQFWAVLSPNPCGIHPVVQRLRRQIDYWSKTEKSETKQAPSTWQSFAAKAKKAFNLELARVQQTCERDPDLLQDGWIRFRLDAADSIIKLSQGPSQPPSELRLDSWLQDFPSSTSRAAESLPQPSGVSQAQWQRCKRALLAADLEWLRNGARATSHRQSLLKCLPEEAPELQIQAARRLARLQGDAIEALRRAYFTALAQSRRAQASSFAASLALELLEHKAGWKRAWEWYEHARALDPIARGHEPSCAFLRYVALRIHLHREPSAQAYVQSLSRLAEDPGMRNYGWRLKRDAIDFARGQGDYPRAQALREELQDELQALGTLNPADLFYLYSQQGVDLLIEGKAEQAERYLSSLEAQADAETLLELRTLSLWSAWLNQDLAAARLRLEALTQVILNEVSGRGCQAYEQEQWQVVLSLEARILSAPGPEEQSSIRARLAQRCPMAQQLGPTTPLNREFSQRLLGASKRRFDEQLRLLDPQHERCPPST